MQHPIFLFLYCIFYSVCTLSQTAQLDTVEARKAFELINCFRDNPSLYGKKININLKNVKKQKALYWNTTLSKAAEKKALDMANRNYFSHTTPEGKGINILIHEAGYSLPKEYIKKKNANYFESIVAGAKNGEDAVFLLIADENTPSLGHRKHLLGIDNGTPFNSELTDIGIGYVRCFNENKCKYETYVSVIIAMKK